MVQDMKEKFEGSSGIRHPRTPNLNAEFNPTASELRGPNSRIWANRKILRNQQAIASKSPTKARTGWRKRTDQPSRRQMDGSSTDMLEGQSWDGDGVMEDIRGEEKETIPDDDLDAYVDAYQAERQLGDEEEESDSNEEGDKDALKTLMGHLEQVSPPVAAFFQRTVGLKARIDPRLKHLYRVLLEQIAAEEYAVQMVNVSTLPALGDSQNWRTASKLVNIPGLYNVLEAERRRSGIYPSDLIKVCRWLYKRITEVYQRLARNDHATVPLTANQEDDDWKMGDGDPKKSIQEASKSTGCRKLYTSYDQQQLTGGIMGAWCTHSICYGFHFIPKAEGRNDVFAAILTRWKKAPH
ncbi:hypothetical protein V5O48_017994 [Marasmius crinis-equi]|uniref:Uncharacterized protein n=1 Tax=Marasmius crinis-equi TaxID=585013 RepID=A0ABR3EMG0_9AGAR